MITGTDKGFTEMEISRLEKLSEKLTSRRKRVTAFMRTHDVQVMPDAKIPTVE